jgi:hypothetical protein
MYVDWMSSIEDLGKRMHIYRHPLLQTITPTHGLTDSPIADIIPEKLSKSFQNSYRQLPKPKSDFWYLFTPTFASYSNTEQVIFFGANDACLPLAGGHHVPLADYRQNIQKIIEHPTVKAQSPRIILITPPPVNEYQHLEEDRQKAFDTLRRTAKNTKLYVDACKDVGKSLGIPVVDIWSAFLKKAGWVEGETLVGSLERPESEIFTGLFSDGTAITLKLPV